MLPVTCAISAHPCPTKSARMAVWWIRPASCSVRHSYCKEHCHGDEFMGDVSNTNGAAADELRAANAWLAEIVDIAEDAIISVNARQEIVLFNLGAEKVFGYRAAEMIGQPLDRLIPERFVASHRQDVERFGQSAEVSR